MPEDLKGAILQRDRETYAIVPRMPAGMLSVDNIEALSRVVRKYGIPIVKITSGQRMALVGIKQEDIDGVWQDLEMEIGHATELCYHYVQACPGTAVCRFGVQDSIGLASEIDQFLYARPLPAKLKVGISGCPFCCGESYVRDIGVMGKKNGYTLIAGGNSGGRPRIGDVVAEDISREAVLSLMDAGLKFYQAEGRKKERMARFIDRVGIEAFKSALNE